MGKWARWLVRLIGPALLVLFLWRTDWNALLSQFGSIAWWPVVVSMLLMPPFVAIKAWRWNLLMRELGLDAPPLGYAIVLYTIGLFLGGTTPGQSGDFIKAWYLRDRGLALPPVLFSIVLDRLFDFLVMALLALLTLVAFINLLPESAITATIVFAGLIIIVTPLLMARRSREWLMTRTLPFAPQRIRVVVERWRDQFATLSLRPGLLMLLVLASVGSAVATMLRIYLLYLALPLDNVPLLAIISSTALIALLQALPISFAGIGVRDAVLIAVLAQYGYEKELAIILSALFLLLNIEHIIIGFLVSLRYPLGTPPETVAQIEGAEPTAR
jgi:uncharacterized protein (TIRG00374 family)